MTPSAQDGSREQEERDALHEAPRDPDGPDLKPRLRLFPGMI